MSWRPIVVGVDGSPESVRAAAFGCYIARQAGTSCHLVHSIPDYWSAYSVPEMQIDAAELDRAAEAHARGLIAQSLEDRFPDDLVRDITFRVGRAPVVLATEARRLRAEAVVLGGKHHRMLARLGGSTLTHMVRMGTVPMLAVDGTRETPPGVGRILAAVDMSYAAKPTLDAAQRWAALVGARLRVLYVVEPMPIVPGFSLKVADDEVYRSAQRLVETGIAPLLTHPDAEIVLRRGRAAAAIATESESWRADLVVVGSHGKGWVDRLLIGSTSERILQVLPAPTLVVPVAKPGGKARDVGLELPWEAGATG